MLETSAISVQVVYCWAITLMKITKHDDKQMESYGKKRQEIYIPLEIDPEILPLLAVR